MKTKIILCSVFFTLCIALTIAQNQRALTQDRVNRKAVAEDGVLKDKRAKIKDYLNREIVIDDAWAGQSITLIKENEDYFVLRQFHGSGVPIVGSEKYKVVFQSDWQIRFSEIVESSRKDTTRPNEGFQLGVDEKGINLYLNGLKVVIKEPLLDK